MLSMLYLKGVILWLKGRIDAKIKTVKRRSAGQGSKNCTTGFPAADQTGRRRRRRAHKLRGNPPPSIPRSCKRWTCWRRTGLITTTRRRKTGDCPPGDMHVRMPLSPPRMSGLQAHRFRSSDSTALSNQHPHPGIPREPAPSPSRWPRGFGCEDTINESPGNLADIQMERHYSKEAILEIYLNRVFFGGRYYGIEMAAQAYFNKSASN